MINMESLIRIRLLCQLFLKNNIPCFADATKIHLLSGTWYISPALIAAYLLL